MSIFSGLSFFKRIMSNDPLTIFAPIDTKECPVKVLSDEFKSQNQLVVFEPKDKLEQHFDEKQMASFNEKVMMFSHPDFTNSGFLTQNGCLNANWWNNSMHRVSFVFAYVCFGAKILRRKDWDNVFKSWASFGDEILFFKGGERPLEIYLRLFYKISKGLQEVQNHEEFKQMVDQKFVETIKELNSRLDESKGDYVVLLTLSAAHSSLTFSQ